MKKLLLLLFALSLTQLAMADKAADITRTVRQNDGTQLTIHLVGDEHISYYATDDGLPLMQNNRGDWTYAVLDGNAMIFGTRLAHSQQQRSAEEHAYAQGLTTRAVLHQQWAERLEEANRLRTARAAKLRTMAQAQHRKVARATQQAPVAKKKGIIILVNYQDVKMAATSTQEVFDQIANGINAPYGKNHGSIHEYFLAQSYGQFDLHFDIAGPYTVSKEMDYYGQDNDTRKDVNAKQMISEACMLAEKDINFADYDWDGDGEVEQVYVIYAGYSQSSGGADNTIWPHESRLNNAIYPDGVRVSTYACSSELSSNRGTTITGIGTACHEFSHCLGLPDFYDTSYSNNFAMGMWDLMSSGSHNDGGFHPIGFTAYERWFSGWLEPTVLNTATKVQDMPAIEEQPVAYVIYNDANQNEYYLLANYQKTGFDSYIPAHGMMVNHVTYDSRAWYSNTVNNDANLQRMTLIAADGVFNGGSEAGDLWPGPAKKTTLSDNSSPAATLYTANTDGAKLMHKPIEHITEEDGTITFQFMGGIYVPTPEIIEPEVTSNSFTARWKAVEGVDSYNLQWREKTSGATTPAEALLMEENFEKLTTTTGSDGTQNVDAQIDDYTTMPGWLPENVYPGKSGAKVGKTSGGSLSTPLFEAPLNESVTVYFTASQYGTDSNLADIILLSADGNELQTQRVSLGNRALVINFTNVYEAFRIKFKPVKRGYLSQMSIYDGNFTKADIEASKTSDAVKQQSTSTSVKAPLRAASNMQTVKGIKRTSYMVRPAKNGATYIYRIQAVNADGIKSEWTAEQRVIVNGTGDAIELVKANSSAETITQVYDTNGRLVYAAPTTQFNLWDVPAHGVLIVKTGSSIRKVIH